MLSEEELNLVINVCKKYPKGLSGRWLSKYILALPDVVNVLRGDICIGYEYGAPETVLACYRQQITEQGLWDALIDISHAYTATFTGEYSQMHVAENTVYLLTLDYDPMKVAKRFKLHLTKATGEIVVGRRKAGVCKNGHDLTGENLYVSPQGQRQCRVCKSEKYFEKKKKAAKA